MLAELLVKGNQPREQIVHVTAHGLAADGYEAGFLFGGEGARRRNEISMRLRHMDFKLQNDPVPGPPEGPLAVLSSCHGANEQFESPIRIPEKFQEAGYRAVIAPLMTINIPSAVEISGRLFELLEENMPIGHALVLARRWMLERYGNPLGLLYVGFGEMSLRIASEVNRLFRIQSASIAWVRLPQCSRDRIR